jgi:hypothetical protein
VLREQVVWIVGGLNGLGVWCCDLNWGSSVAGSVLTGG